MIFYTDHRCCLHLAYSYRDGLPQLYLGTFFSFSFFSFILFPHSPLLGVEVPRQEAIFHATKSFSVFFCGTSCHITNQLIDVGPTRYFTACIYVLITTSWQSSLLISKVSSNNIKRAFFNHLPTPLLSRSLVRVPNKLTSPNPVFFFFFSPSS